MGQHQLNHLPQKPKNTHRHIAFLPLVMAPAQSQSALFQKPTEESKRNGIKHFGCFMKDELDLDSMDQLRPEHINDNELKNSSFNYRTTLFTTTPSPRQRPSRSHTLIPLSYNGCPPSSWRWRKRNDSRICGENATHLTMNRFGIKTSGERSLTTGIRDGLSMARRTLPPTLMRRWETKSLGITSSPS